LVNQQPSRSTPHAPSHWPQLVLANIEDRFVINSNIIAEINKKRVIRVFVIFNAVALLICVSRQKMTLMSLKEKDPDTQASLDKFANDVLQSHNGHRNKHSSVNQFHQIQL